jgi:phosphate transport system protein
MANHLLSEFDALLSRLEDSVLRMGGLDKEVLATAANGLFLRDADACNAVIAADEEIDRLETDVGRLALEIVSRFTPVARDLRTALSAMRLATSLERVGDECVTIARKTKLLLAAPERRETKLLEPLVEQTRRLFSDALVALANRDGAAAGEIARRDVDLDALCNDITDKLTAAVQRPEGLPGPEFTHLAMIARCLERIGDQAKNVATETMFRINPLTDHHTY